MRLAHLNLPSDFQYSVSPLMIAIVAVLVFILPSDWQTALVYARFEIDNGAAYRLLTGHFVHTNLWHLSFNLFGLALLWALHGEYYRWQSILIFSVCTMLLIAYALYLFSPHLFEYVGLSGYLHALFAWGAVQDIRRKMTSGYILLLGLIIKLVNEQIFGAGNLMPQLIDAQVAINSHLFGAIVGFGYAAASVFMPHTQSKA